MTTIFHRLLGGYKDDLKRFSFDFINLKDDTALDENIDKIKINNDLVLQLSDAIKLANLLKTFTAFNPINTSKKISNVKRMASYRDLLAIIFANLWKQVDSIKNESNIYIKAVRANSLLKSMEKNIKGLPEINEHQEDYDNIKHDLDDSINQTKDILKKFREFTQQFENLKKQGSLNELEKLKINVQSLETLSEDQYSNIKKLYGLAVNLFKDFEHLEPQKNKLIEDIKVEIAKLQNNEEQARKNQEQVRITQQKLQQSREDQARMEVEQAKMAQEILTAKAQRQQLEQESNERERQRLARINKVVVGITPKDNIVDMDLILAQYLLNHRRRHSQKKSTRNSRKKRRRKSMRRTNKRSTKLLP